MVIRFTPKLMLVFAFRSLIRVPNFSYTVVPHACSSVTRVVACRETATLIESVCDLHVFAKEILGYAMLFLRVLLRKFLDTGRS